MSLQDKYRAVLELGEKLGVKDGYVNEEGNVLKMGGVAKTQMDKDQIWDKIKEIGGDPPSDIEADIKVEVTDYYGTYTVKSGDSLSKIAKKYLGSANRYMDIFNLNTDILKNPDLIHPGQVLKIPFGK